MTHWQLGTGATDGTCTDNFRLHPNLGSSCQTKSSELHQLADLTHVYTYLHDHGQACGQIVVNRWDVLTALLPNPCQPSVYMGIKQAIDDVLVLLGQAWHSLQQRDKEQPVRLTCRSLVLRVNT